MARFEVNSKGEARDTLEDSRLATLNKLEDLKNNSGRIANPEEEKYWRGVEINFSEWKKYELWGLVYDRVLQQRILKTEGGKRILRIAKDSYRARLEADLQRMKDSKKDKEAEIKHKEKRFKEINSTPPEDFADGNKELGERVKETKRDLSNPEYVKEDILELEEKMKKIEEELQELNKS